MPFSYISEQVCVFMALYCNTEKLSYGMYDKFHFNKAYVCIEKCSSECACIAPQQSCLENQSVDYLKYGM